MPCCLSESITAPNSSPSRLLSAWVVERMRAIFRAQTSKPNSKNCNDWSGRDEYLCRSFSRIIRVNARQTAHTPYINWSSLWLSAWKGPSKCSLVLKGVNSEIISSICLSWYVMGGLRTISLSSAESHWSWLLGGDAYSWLLCGGCWDIGAISTRDPARSGLYIGEGHVTLAPIVPR